jgi:hypothetical protein
MKKYLSRTLLVSFALAASAQAAHANGRPPGTIDVKVRSGGTEIAAATSFGLVVSENDGTTWRWVCEANVGYGGTYDPDYEWSSTGKLLATSAESLRTSSDRCAYDLLPGLLLSGQNYRYISATTFGPDGALYAAASDDNDGMLGSKIYRSTNEGMTFPQVSTAAPAFKRYDAWQSIEVAPSDATRVYIAGIRAAANQPRVFLLYRSNDAAATFTPMTLTGITGLEPPGMQLIQIAGVSYTNPNVLYVRVTRDGGTMGDGIYRSADGGASWTKVLSKPDVIAFVVRRNGDVLAATPTEGAFKSTDGINFTPLAGAPHLNCLTERADGTLFGCTQNYGTGADNAGVMKSTDGIAWTSLLRYQDIEGPKACAVGTPQKDECEIEEWCGIREQLGIASTVINCPLIVPDGMPDAGQPPSSSGGCCETNQTPPSLLLCGLTVVLLAWRKRRPRR